MLSWTVEQVTCHRAGRQSKESRGRNTENRTGLPASPAVWPLANSGRLEPTRNTGLAAGDPVPLRPAGVPAPVGGGRQGRRHHVQERRPGHLRGQERWIEARSKSAPIRWGRCNVHWGEVTGPWRARASSRCRCRRATEYYGALRPAAPGQVIGGGRRDGGHAGPVRHHSPDADRQHVLDPHRRLGRCRVQFRAGQHRDASDDKRVSQLPRPAVHALGATLSSNITTREDADRTFRSNLNLQCQPILRRSVVSRSAWGVVEQNDELSLDLRLLGAGGFGRDIVHTNHRLWSVFSGLAYTHEQFSGEPSDQSLEAALGGQLDFFTPMNDDFDFTNRIVSYFRLGGREPNAPRLPDRVDVTSSSRISTGA